MLRRYSVAWCAVLAAMVVWGGLAATPALAHRVNIFAYVEGDAVHVDCSYSRNDRVHFGDIQVKNAKTGELYLSGKTDAQGHYTFTIPPAAKTAKADLEIFLNAGEGHQNHWVVEAKEYLNQGDAASTTSAAPTATPTSAVAAPAAATSSGTGPGLSPAVLQAVVEKAVEKKVAPILTILVDERKQGPGFTEIAGGIGYLVGLAGLLAYARSRGGRPRS